MKGKGIMIMMIILCLMLVFNSLVFAEGNTCDINKIISENQRISALEGQQTRDYFDTTKDAIFVEMEAKGWDWLSAVQMFVKEQVKKLVIVFAISIFGAIMIINGIAGIIFLRMQRNKFILINESICNLTRLYEEAIAVKDKKNKKDSIKDRKNKKDSVKDSKISETSKIDSDNSVKIDELSNQVAELVKELKESKKSEKLKESDESEGFEMSSVDSKLYKKAPKDKKKRGFFSFLKKKRFISNEDNLRNR